MESAPLSATSAVSGGATGLPATKTTQPSILRRHPVATGIAAGVVAVVLVSGLTAWGVGTAVTASLTSSASDLPMGASTGTPAPTGMGAAGMGAAGKGSATSTGRQAFRATIQSMDGDNWTILTRKGKTVTVTVNGATQFGTMTTSETAGSFAVGDSVVIIAMRGADGMPTAMRVIDSASLTPSLAPSTTPSISPSMSPAPGA